MAYLVEIFTHYVEGMLQLIYCGCKEDKAERKWSNFVSCPERKLDNTNIKSGNWCVALWNVHVVCSSRARRSLGHIHSYRVKLPSGLRQTMYGWRKINGWFCGFKLNQLSRMPKFRASISDTDQIAVAVFKDGRKEEEDNFIIWVSVDSIEWSLYI